MIRRILGNHLVMSAIYKGLSGLALFVSIPLMISYLGESGYGVWILVFTLFQWVLLLDFGLASVLKTKIPELKLQGNHALMDAYIKATYKVTIWIAAGILLFFSILIYSLNLKEIFNIPFDREFVNNIFLINILLFCVNFVLNTHKSLFVSIFKGKFAEQSLAVNQIAFLGAVALAMLLPVSSVEKRLYLVSILSGGVCFLVNLGYTFYVFKTEKFNLLTKERPPKDFLSGIYSLGIKYMIIQTGILFLFSSDNYILAYFYSPKDIVPYEIVSKYFQFPLLILMAGMAPLWSMFSKRYLEADKHWLLETFRKFNLFYVVVLAGIAICVVIAPLIMEIWIGPGFQLPQALLITVAVMTALRIFSLFYSYFFNGIGNLKSYLILLLISVLVKIPLSYLFITLNFGLSSVVLASAVCLLGWCIVQPAEAYKLVSKL